MQTSRSSGWPHRSGVCNFGRDWKVFLENTGSKVTHAEVSSLKPPYRSQFTLESRPQILCLGGVTDKISLFAVSSLLWSGTSSTFCIPPMNAAQDGCSPHPSCPPPCLWCEWCGIETICPPEFLADPPISSDLSSPALAADTRLSRRGASRLPVSDLNIYTPCCPEWRGGEVCDVLGYVKSNPPGCILNRLPLLEKICEQIYLREKFLRTESRTQRHTR